MLAKIRSRGVEVALTADGQLTSSGTMSALQRQYLASHEAELVALLWAEDGATVCVNCGVTFDCHEEGRYAEYANKPDGEPGILCGQCCQYIDWVMARYEAGENLEVKKTDSGQRKRTER